jgi:hypothetical protein
MEDMEDEIMGEDGIGISNNFGLKLGFEAMRTPFYGGFNMEHDAEYINNDFFFEEGNSTSKFMITLSSYINYT